MLKWFSVSGIMAEVKRIRWPSKKDMAQDSGKVLLFCFFFGVFFVFCESFVTIFLKLIGIGA